MAVRFGSGSLRFEYVDGWEHLPAGYAHADVPSVCTDSDLNVYLFCRGDHPVMVYDRDGNFIDSWGEGRFSFRVHGMHMRRDDQMLLVDDSGHSVGRYSLNGELLQSYGPSGVPSETGYDGKNTSSVQYGAGPFNRPTNASVGPGGDVYVSDGYTNSRIHHFNASGELLGSWGEPGIGKGEFHIPHSVWVHTDGRVFVADRSNNRIQIFSPSGEFLTEWTHVHRPQDIFIDKNNLVYVCEMYWMKGETSPRRGPILEEEPGRFSIFDIDGNVLLQWSDPDPLKPGYFLSPHGLWVDDEGSIYVGTNSETAGKLRGVSGALGIQKFARI